MVRDSEKDKRNEGKKQTLTCAGPRPPSIRIQNSTHTPKKRTFHALHRQFVLENEGRRGGETQAGLGNYLFCALDVASEN
jgi:hypothetical protein